jgi:hypothetical protein
MKRAINERNFVVVLFILVLIAFSFAERDTRKLDELYNKRAQSFEPTKKDSGLSTIVPVKKPTVIAFTRN